MKKNNRIYKQHRAEGGGGGGGGALNLLYNTDVRLEFFVTLPIHIFWKYQNIYLFIYLVAKRHPFHNIQLRRFHYYS